MATHIDRTTNKGVLTDLHIERDSGGKKLIVNDVQDVDPILRNNAITRDYNRTDANRGEWREIADIPTVIARQWKNMYGFDVLSAANSNWGYGMTRDEHKKFLRKLLNANPALKTVNESL